MSLHQTDWIVIPGGPGLSNEYLRFAFTQLISINANLHFYNPYGSPESSGETHDLEALIDQIPQVAYDKGLTHYGLIAHSFGSYLALRALERTGDDIDALIMLNPIPYQYHHWQQALINIQQRIPQSVADRIAKLSEHTSISSEFFKLILPYYTGIDNPTDLPSLTELPEIPLDMQACERIASQVPNYDDKSILESINCPIAQIVGGKDPFFKDEHLLKDKTIVMPDLGHYPFLEDPNAFKQTFDKVEVMLSRL